MSQEFKTLKQGVIDLICRQAGQALEAPSEPEEPVFGDMDALATTIDGVGVMLTYKAAFKKDGAFMFTDFGPLPPDRELKAMRRLMEVNFMLYRGGAPTFTRDPDSGHIMLMSEVPLAQATPELVLQYMRELARQALQWRQDFYLDAAAEPRLGAMAAMA